MYPRKKQLKKQKMSKSSNPPHYVDETTETVYVSTTNLNESVSAKQWSEQTFPGYTIVLLSPNDLTKKIKGDTESNA